MLRARLDAFQKSVACPLRRGAEMEHLSAAGDLCQKVYSVEQSSCDRLAAVVSRRIDGRFLPGEKARTDAMPGGWEHPLRRTWSNPPLAADRQPVTGPLDSEALSGGKFGDCGRQHAAPLGSSPAGAQPGPHSLVGLMAVPLATECLPGPLYSSQCNSTTRTINY